MDILSNNVFLAHTENVNTGLGDIIDDSHPINNNFRFEYTSFFFIHELLNVLIPPPFDQLQMVDLLIYYGQNLSFLSWTVNHELVEYEE
jgi:hypothetical protein